MLLIILPEHRFRMLGSLLKKYNTPDHELEHLTIIAIDNIAKILYPLQKSKGIILDKLVIDTVCKGINRQYSIGDTVRIV